MMIITQVVIGLVAILHVYFMILEMFFWTKPLGRKTFGLTREQAELSETLAANQGLYNGFLAAGLFWGLWLGPQGTHIQMFFLGCVMLAGLFGAATANIKILFVQALPAFVGLLLLWF
jgi:putative membrane protein